jgi:hypothetical protein
MPTYRCFDIGGSGIKTTLFNTATDTFSHVVSLPVPVADDPGTTPYHEAFLTYLHTVIPSYTDEINTPNYVIYISLAGVVEYVDARGPTIMDDWKGGILPRFKGDWPADKREYGYSLRTLFGVKNKPSVRLYAISDNISHGIGNLKVLEKATAEEYCLITLGTGVSVSFFRKTAGVLGETFYYQPNPLLSLDNFRLDFNRQQLASDDPYFSNDPRLVTKEIWSFLGFGNYEEGVPGLHALRDALGIENYKNIVTKRLQCLLAFLYKFVQLKEMPGFNIYIAGGGKEFVNYSCLGGNVFKASENTAFNGIQYVLRHDAAGTKGKLPNSGRFVDEVYYPADIVIGHGAFRKRHTSRLRKQRKRKNTRRR